MTKIMLIRHGQSMANLEEIYVGNTDSELTPLGRKQAQCTAQYIFENFEVDKVYASSLRRAYDTGKAVADKFGLDVNSDDRLKEIYGGEWEGKKFVDLVKNYPEEFGTWLNDLGNAFCPGGETIVDLKNRVMEALFQIAQENDGKKIVIATHATPIRILQVCCEEKSLVDMKNIPWVSNASVSFVKYENGKFIMERAGFDEHLGEMATHLPEKI